MRSTEPMGASPQLKIQYLTVGELVPDPRNVRRHTAKQIAKLAHVIRTFGWATPIIVDESKLVLAGHARLSAARELGLQSVPCVQLRHLTLAQKKALAIADNKLSDESAFDDDALRQVLIELGGLDFDVELTGFDTAEIDVLLDVAGERADPDDAFEAPAADQPAVSRPGDLWLLGRHRLYCGDALSEVSYAALLGDARAQMVITDPPYNVPINGHVRGRGHTRHREFTMCSGEMSDAEFAAFLSTAMSLMVRFSQEGSIHFHFMDWRHLQILLGAGGAHYTELKNICVWAKTNAGQGSLYRSQHELIVVFKHGAAPHINNVELGRHGRWRSNVWTYPGGNSFGRTREGDLEAHPTVKPVALIADAMRDCSKRGGLVLDPFAGSGTILLAAERTGRRAAAMEIDPLYVDTAIRRWQAKTGEPAVLAGEGQTFEEVGQARSNEASTAICEGGL